MGDSQKKKTTKFRSIVFDFLLPSDWNSIQSNAYGNASRMKEPIVGLRYIGERCIVTSVACLSEIFYLHITDVCRLVFLPLAALWYIMYFRM